MNTGNDKSIKVGGNISGTNIIVGADNISIQINRRELVEQLEALKAEIKQAEIPVGTKEILLEKIVPKMSSTAESDDPQSGIKQGLEQLDDRLKAVGTTIGHVSGIVETVKNIAKTVGVAVGHVAPYIASLL